MPENQPKKLRVAFLVSRFPVLSQTFVINQATGLLDRGCEVDIFTGRLEDGVKMHAAIEEYGLLARTHVLPSVPDNYLVRLIKGIQLLVRYGPRYPRQILQALNVRRLGIRAVSLWALFTAIPTLELPNYDIVHCQFGDLGFRGLLLRDLIRLRQQQLESPTRLVVMFRGFDISAKLQSEGDRIYRFLFDKADFFLTNCDFFRRRLLALGCPPDRIKVHYSGLACDKFNFQVRQLPPNETVRIATTGRLVEKKGLAYSIQAVAKVAEYYPNVHFDIVGDGPLRETLGALIESLQMANRIHLLGWKNEAEIIQVLSRSHLFVAPSVTAANGNQDAPINVLKEAMALGLPVVSTTHGGIPELVEDGVSGFLVPERDADAIARVLIWLIEHPQQWPEMGRAGRTYVEQHYGLSDLNDRLVALYEQLATNSSQLSYEQSACSLEDLSVLVPPL
ncbi:MAG: glycosyltransferase [Cyanobacteria bacterium J06581_3]